MRLYVCKCEQATLGVTPLVYTTLVLFPHFAFGKQVNAVWKTTLSCPPNNQGTAVGSARAEVESERPLRSRAHEP